MAEVGGMDECSDLVADRFGQYRVGVPKAAYRDPADRVQVALSVLVEQPCAFAALERHRHPGVGIHQVGIGHASMIRKARAVRGLGIVDFVTSGTVRSTGENR